MVDIVNIAPQPGLPDLVFGPVPEPVVELASDALSAILALGPSPWGIYQGGAPVVVADTVADLGYVKGYAISDHPVEPGAFASYDKVEEPFEARVRFVSGGSPDVRQALILSIEAVVGDLDLYDIITPDKVYINANLVRMEYRRTAQEGGGSLLAIDVTLQEVRVTPGDTMGATQAPSGADPVNVGNVQPTAPPPGIGSDARFPTSSVIPSATPFGAGGIGRN